MTEIKFNLTLNFNPDGSGPPRPTIINLPENTDGGLTYIFDEVIIPHSKEYLKEIEKNDFTDLYYYILENITFRDSNGNLQHFKGIDYEAIIESTEEKTVYKNFKIIYE